MTLQNLGNTTTFNETFAFPIQRNYDEEAVCKFKKATTPFLLRRLKTGGKEASLSGKAELLNEILGIITESHEKALIFNQFREMGEILAHIIEEKIDSMIQSKKHLAEMTVATGENWIGSLSNRDLNEIFRL